MSLHVTCLSLWIKFCILTSTQFVTMYLSLVVLLQFFSLSGYRECNLCSNKPETFVVNLQEELGTSRCTEFGH